MKFTIVTIFPEMFASMLDASLLGKARARGDVEVVFVDPRAFTGDRHRTVDDSPYGGGPGMVMKVEPLLSAIESAGPAHRILLTPAGAPLRQERVRELAVLKHVLLICGRYEGIDERVSELAVDEQLSIGDFVLSGGEPAAMVLIDAVSRYVPGVLGQAESVVEESFSDGLLEYPQYTRPLEVRGLAVPEVLTSGDHAAIARWRGAAARQRTAARRPELLPSPDPASSYVALVHHPVLDRDGDIVTTSVTNLDIHDIARSAATFGLAGYFPVTPITAQREMIERIVNNWGAEGDGPSSGDQDSEVSAAEPAGGPQLRPRPLRYDERGVALASVRPVASIADAVAEIQRRHRAAPQVVATSARHRPGAVWRPPLDPERPLLVLFGTGHGLPDNEISACDHVLMPIDAGSGFNHLSVRSAAAILLWRLFGKTVPSGVKNL